jgi:hypothetical protein
MFQARFKPISNQSDWSTAIQFNDKASGTPVDITGGGSPANSFTLALQLAGTCNAPALQGSTATGELTTPSLGILLIYFPVGRMQSLTPGSYRVGLTVTNAIFTTEIFLGLLPVVNGIVGQSAGPNWDYS